MSTLTYDMTGSMYFKIFVLLIVLTILTFLQPYVLPGNINDTVSAQLFIALIKSILIGSYYMHLKYESALFKNIVLMAIVVLAIFFIITATDAIYRNESFDLFQ